MSTNRAWTYLALAVVLLAITWGARLTILEGFVSAWNPPRSFGGDFNAVMFADRHWNGRGIAYGPIFVAEHWLVTWRPRLFTIHLFAVANVVLVAGAFVFCVRACRAHAPLILLGLAAWLCYWRLFYGFSVAAHPEFLELFLLSWAWFSVARRRDALEGGLIAAAGLTKLIPWVFALPLLLRRSGRGLSTAAIVAVITITVVAVGQRMTPWAALVQSVFPFGGKAAPPLTPYSGSTQFVGLLEMLDRSLHGLHAEPITAGQLQVVRALFAGIMVAVLAVTVWATIRLVRRRTPVGDESCWALLYSMYFALVPVLTVATHPHTYLFLLPVWIALPHQLWKGPESRPMRAAFGLCLAFCYVVTGFPAALKVADRIFHTSTLDSRMMTEPMFGNLLLLALIWTFIAVRTKGHVTGHQSAV